MSLGKVFRLLFGAMMVAVAFALGASALIAGSSVLFGTDSDDYFTTPRETFSSTTYAITTKRIDLGRPGPQHRWPKGKVGTVRIKASSQTPLFVGVGPAREVEAYLQNIEHDEVIDVRYHPFATSMSRQFRSGTRQPARPGLQTFWVAQSTAASPSATATLTWDVSAGEWEAVIMNADATQVVDARVSAGVKINWLGRFSIATGSVALLMLAVGITLLAAGGRQQTSSFQSAQATTGSSTATLRAGQSPVQLVGHLDPNLSRWTWLVKWFLAIPHFVILAVLWTVFAVLTLVAMVAILFTGKYPRSIFDFNVGVLRWSWRVGFYANSALGTDKYPPFTLADVDYPARLTIAYPEKLSRGLVLVKWLLALPHLFIIGFLTSSAAWSWSWGKTGDTSRFSLGGGLIGLLSLVAGVILLFTGRYPKDLYDIILGFNRWVYRVAAYVSLMTDTYPPFRLDQGPDEPSVGAPPSPPESSPPSQQLATPSRQLTNS